MEAAYSALRAPVGDALRRVGLSWDNWPTAAYDARLTPVERRSAALLLLGDSRRTSLAGRESLERLQRFRLPWDPPTAAVALDVVRDAAPHVHPGFDATGAGIALGAAESTASDGAADVALMDACDRFATWLETLSGTVWGVPEARRRARRVRALMTPPGFLDLSVIDERDHWGPIAIAAARGCDPDGIAPLVRALGSLGPRKPPARWRSDIGTAVAAADAEALITLWLDAALAVLALPPEAHGILPFTPGNTDLIRAAVLASATSDRPGVVATLGRLAVLGAETSGRTEARALRVASTAIDVLAERGGPDERAALARLLGEIRRRDLIHRIGAATGQGDDATARAEHLRVEKQRAVQRKASAEPRLLRAEQDRMLRANVAPALRALGFVGGVRTWRRHHDDRTDLVSFHSSDGRLDVEYGVVFRCVHPTDRPGSPDFAKVADYDLDIRVVEEATPSEQVLRRVATRLEQVIDPFLDSFGRPDLASAYVRGAQSVPHGAVSYMARPGSPNANEIAGLLALEAGDFETAVGLLASVVEWHEGERRLLSPMSADELAFWRQRLETAHSRAG